MKIEIELDGDAEQAYERILETLSNQSASEIDPDEHAEHVLRQYIGSEYQQLIVNGDPTKQPGGIVEEMDAE